MFVFEFDATLFRFRLKMPAFDPLFQLPPLTTIARYGPDPATDHSADLVNMAGPDLVTVNIDISQPSGLPHQRPQVLDLDVQLLQRGFLVIALRALNRQMQQPVQCTPDLGRQHMALELGELEHRLVRVGVQLLKLGQDPQAFQVLRHLRPRGRPGGP